MFNKVGLHLKQSEILPYATVESISNFIIEQSTPTSTHKSNIECKQIEFTQQKFFWMFFPFSSEKLFKL